MRTQALATESNARAVGNVVEWPNGERFGTWRVVDRLGRGGTAEVWHARACDGREAALKLAAPALRTHPGAGAPLRREHALLHAVASPHLVEPYALLEHSGAVVLVLEYLPHGDLVPLLGSQPRHWLPAVRRVLAALLDLQRHGLGHGDVKAANVLFARDGSARLTDLASARPLDAQAAAATAAHALPAGARPLVYQLLTGRLPYGREGAMDLAQLPAVTLADPAAEPLLAATEAALRAGGRVQGLSYFVDVIESVRTI